jgi:sec-independent protein translocase protein TatA
MSLGPMQIILIILVVILLFGAGKLSRVMGDAGKGIRAFKSGLKGDDEQKSIDHQKDSDSQKN